MKMKIAAGTVADRVGSMGSSGWGDKAQPNGEGAVPRKRKPRLAGPSGAVWTGWVDVACDAWQQGRRDRSSTAIVCSDCVEEQCNRYHVEDEQPRDQSEDDREGTHVHNLLLPTLRMAPMACPGGGEDMISTPWGGCQGPVWPGRSTKLPSKAFVHQNQTQGMDSQGTVGRTLGSVLFLAALRSRRGERYCGGRVTTHHIGRSRTARCRDRHRDQVQPADGRRST